jgi:hypothetical protein
LLGLAWFYSSESGLFNGLQPIQIKKFLAPLSPPAGAQRAAHSIRRVGKGIAHNLIFAKQMRKLSVRPTLDDFASVNFVWLEPRSSLGAIGRRKTGYGEAIQGSGGAVRLLDRHLGLRLLAMTIPSGRGAL